MKLRWKTIGGGIVCGIVGVAAMIHVSGSLHEYHVIKSLQKAGATVYLDDPAMWKGDFRQSAATSKWLFRDCLIYNVDGVAFLDTPATDTSVLPLADLPSLCGVGLNGTGVTDKTAERLSRVRMLQSARFSGTSVTGAGLQSMSSCSQLNFLFLDCSTVNDSTIFGLKGWPALRYIQVFRANVTNDALRSLSDIHTLRSIVLLDAGHIDDIGIAYLQTLTNLESLQVINAPITDKTLQICSSWKSLKFLRLNSPQITDEGLAALQGLSDLETVGLSRSAVQNLEVLAALPRLKTLELENTPITDASIEVLSHSPSTTSLTLSWTSLTDRSLEHLTALSTLRELRVGPKVSESAARKLHEALPGCTIEGIDQSGTIVFKVPNRK